MARRHVIPELIAERFRLSVYRDSEDTCWIWLGQPSAGGYGAFLVGGRNGKIWKAHRYSYFMAYGPIPNGIDVLHKCDVRDCVNPSHLFLGTHADNMTDMKRKGRQSRLKGSNNGQCHLTEDDVRAIRASEESQTALAARYGVIQAHISRIKRGLAWSHI
jgi:hypothetical protein